MGFKEIKEVVALENEVDERLNRIWGDPELLRRYDLDGDGDISEAERVLLLRIVSAEVYSEFLQTRVQTSDTPELLKGRYKIRRAVGSGGQGHTYLARDLTTDQDVAVKELAVVRLNDWKSLELFEREARVLMQIDHPAIPRFIEAFHIDNASGRRFFIAREYIFGKDLQSRLDDGERFLEERVRDIIDQVADVLSFLHALEPPLIHRDIKPSNLIETEDGRLRVVDFGSVQDSIPKTIGGSTVSGTPGYMPIEQVLGQSNPKSDVYALGATCLHLISRRQPSSFGIVRAKLDFEPIVTVSSTMNQLLSGMLEPDVVDRLSLDEVRGLLLSRHDLPIVVSGIEASASTDLPHPLVVSPRSTELEMTQKGEPPVITLGVTALMVLLLSMSFPSLTWLWISAPILGLIIGWVIRTRKK